MTTLGTHPPRIDLTVRAGEPVDFTVPVLDETGVAVSSLTGWTPTAQVRAATGQPVLATLTCTVAGGSVQVTATGVDTMAWSWTSAQWDLVLTSPAGVPHVLCGGWIRLYPTITRPA